MADRTVSIGLELTPQGNGQKYIKDLTRSMSELEREADAVKLKILEFNRAGKNTDELNRKLKLTEGALANVRQEVSLLTKSFQNASAAANQTRERMEKIAQVGSRLAMAGAAVTAPLLLSVKSYVDKYKETEPIAARFVTAQQNLAAASERVGRVLAEYIVPGMEKAAELASQMAAFVEANPGVAQAALNIGAILTVGGGLITASAQLAGTIATVKGLMGAGGAATGAAGAGTLGTVALYASAVIIGAGIGKEIGNAINRAIGQEVYDPFLAIRQVMQVSVTGWAMALEKAGIITDKFADGVRKAALKFFGLELDDSGPAPTTPYAAALKQTQQDTSELSRAVIELGTASTQAATEITGAANQLRAVDTIISTVSGQIASLMADMDSKAAQRAAQRQKIIDDFNAAQQQAAADHQKALADIERRRLAAVTDAAEQRDALAIDRANEAAEEEIQVEDERFANERNRSRQSLQLQLAQFDAETRLQREADMRKLNELQAKLNAELAMVQQAEEKKLEIYRNTLAQLAAMTAGTVGEMGGGGGPTAIERMPIVPTGGRGTETNQVLNIKMATGQTLSQVRREINSNIRAFDASLSAALRTA